MMDEHTHCREETIRPVTFEIAESSHDGRARFQARARLDGIVIQDLGRPRPTELEALNEITAAFAATAGTGHR